MPPPPPQRRRDSQSPAAGHHGPASDLPRAARGRPELARLLSVGVNPDTAAVLALARATCGTAAGYRRHLRAGQAACRPCRAAHARTQWSWERAS